jgi:hypothetical protein
MYFTYSAFLLSELLAPPFSALLMDLSPYLNLAFGVSALLAGLALALSFPGGLRRGREEREERDEDEEGAHISAPSRAARSAISRGRSVSRESREHDSLIAGGSRDVASDERATWRSRLSEFDSATVVVFFGFLIAPLRQIIVFEILIPYASQRYAISISQVSYVQRPVRLHADMQGFFHTLDRCPRELGLLPHPHTKDVEILIHNNA